MNIKHWIGTERGTQQSFDSYVYEWHQVRPIVADMLLKYGPAYDGFELYDQGKQVGYVTRCKTELGQRPGWHVAAHQGRPGALRKLAMGDAIRTIEKSVGAPIRRDDWYAADLSGSSDNQPGNGFEVILMRRNGHNRTEHYGVEVDLVNGIRRALLQWGTGPRAGLMAATIRVQGGTLFHINLTPEGRCLLSTAADTPTTKHGYESVYAALRFIRLV